MCLRTHQKELDTQTNVAVLVRSIWLRTLYCTMGRFRESSASMQGPPPKRTLDDHPHRQDGPFSKLAGEPRVKYGGRSRSAP